MFNHFIFIDSHAFACLTIFTICLGLDNSKSTSVRGITKVVRITDIQANVG